MAAAASPQWPESTAFMANLTLPQSRACEKFEAQSGKGEIGIETASVAATESPSGKCQLPSWQSGAEVKSKRTESGLPVGAATWKDALNGTSIDAV